MAQSLVSGVSGHKEAQRMTDMAEKFEKIQKVIIFLWMDKFRNYFFIHQLSDLDSQRTS